jgi:transcriptional regulator with XRE-family HTH domain
MNALRSNLREEFHDKEYRHAYADDWLNTFIATQIKVLREQRSLTQKDLAREADMKQPRIAVLEDIDYSSWSINTLRRLAVAFDLRLSVKFEDFSSLIFEAEGFGRESLERASFADDVWFHRKPAQSAEESGIFAAANNEENRERGKRYLSEVPGRENEYESENKWAMAAGAER